MCVCSGVWLENVQDGHGKASSGHSLLSFWRTRRYCLKHKTEWGNNGSNKNIYARFGYRGKPSGKRRRKTGSQEYLLTYLLYSLAFSPFSCCFHSHQSLFSISRTLTNKRIVSLLLCILTRSLWHTLVEKKKTLLFFLFHNRNKSSVWRVNTCT